MDINNNPYDETLVAGAGINMTMDENVDYESFSNNVSKTSTKGEENLQNLLSKVQSKIGHENSY